MKIPTILFIFLLVLPAWSSAALNNEAPDSPDIKQTSHRSSSRAKMLKALPAYSTIYDPQRDAFKDGAAAVALATETNRRILIELGGNWCTWCHRMEAFFKKNPDVEQKLHETFVMLKINVNNENDNAEFLKAFPKALGYPHMYVSEYNGSVLWSKDTAEFVVNGSYSKEAFLTFFDQWNIKNKK
ncbi:hypothetical protein MNBD_GAMMA11-2034 [hydrothermal vent metagenome]|uniref:Thioredoxin domain-containing protein n=1 Tax=hydrothermal vent metagenome TaxID=652676 RepID=A0A3B0X9G8_9ZZZZ